ncbi:peripheral-type benzodiazepine receptor-associated protein 1 isoform X6 [Manis pentadactyla]|uniref:peripheral-type benzodiazepine receptor-associated protein 1 isoform X6 n=1 Tax=Manis pentadactyla TaxID=143292 RepID=UPI00255D0005|nr:peripheral-type benzodiazepine receptor-associated protein 1 isoform X6 [Manis pentadactyla]
MEQLTPLPRLGDPRAMEPWALPAWQSWTPVQGVESEDIAPRIAETPAARRVGEQKPQENSEPEGARSPRPAGAIDPEGMPGLPSLGQQAVSSRPGCPRPEDEEVEAFPKSKLNMGFGDRPNLELLRALEELQQRCAILKEENQMLRKSSFPETEEKVRRLKRKNAELAVIAKRLEERAQKLQETNLKVVSAPVPGPGASLELCRKAMARQRARDLSETASALLAKDKQIAALQRECRELQARLTLVGKEGPQWLHVRDFDRLLRESQREVLRLQRQIALRNQQEPPSPPRPPRPATSARAGAPAPGAPGEAILQEDVENPPVVLGKPEKRQSVQQLESELSKKRKKCESLEQEARKKKRRCEELELQLREAQNENARLVEENSRLSGRATEKEQVEWENVELRGQLLGVTQERDSALRKSQGLQSKLESLEQVLKHMREVAQRRQQLEVEHEQARLSLQEKQEEVQRLQQAQAEARREHEGAVQLLESTLDSMQARVRELEEQCRSQTERFSLLAQELQAFRLHPGPLDLLTSALGCSTLGDHPPLPCCCSAPQPCRGPSPKDLDLLPSSPGRCTPKSSEPTPPTLAGVPRRTAKKAESLSNSSRSESIHNSPKSCPTPEPCRGLALSVSPQVDTASEVEELEADSVSLLPAVQEGSQGEARIQVFLARYSYNPFEGPNENPEAELPLTAGEYIYIYGNMDEDGFFEGELMDGRRGLVPSNFVERVSDDDLLTSLPSELADLSRSSGPELSFLSGGGIDSSSGGQSSGGRSQPRSEDEAAGDELSLSPPPEGLGGPPAVPYPRCLVLLKQLAHSVVLSWEPPPEQVELRGYQVCVNGELRQTLGPGAPPKTVLENLDLRVGPLHVSVQALTSQGSSDPLRCCLVVGTRVEVAPSQLRVHRLTATSAEVTWVPCNSNLAHAIYLNGEECPPARPSTYWATFCHLRPGTLYQARVEAQLPSRGSWEPGWERPDQRAATLQFTTLPAGPPDAPLDVQVEPGPSPGILIISWLPVTIDAAGTSNGVRVTGYAVYADGQKIMEVASPTAGSVLVELSQLQLLQVCSEVAVRTMSPHGESADSLPAPVAPALAVACLPAKVSCPSPRPGLEARPPLAPASPGPGDPSSPLQCPDPHRTQEPPGGLPVSPPRETPKGPQVEPPAPCSQEEAGGPVPGASEDRASEPAVGERAGPAPTPLAKQEARGAPGALAQRVPCAEACHRGDPGTGLRPRAEREDAAELGVRLVNSLVDHGRNSDLSDIQEEEEEEEEEELLASRTCSFQKQVVGNSIRENGAKATETGEPRGSDSSGRRGPLRRGGQAPRLGASELDLSTAPPGSPPEAALVYQDLPVRIFVALFDYDPVSMSPNPDAGEEELPFREGQILKVFGDKDADGFYRGEGGGRTGYIPCNMVAEVAVDRPAGRQQLLQRSYLSSHVLVEGSGNVPSLYSTAHTPGPPPKPRRSKKAESEGAAPPCAGSPQPVSSASLQAPHSLVAAFDYNPRESSPNMDVEAELPFRAGDVITVFGGMDDDGFYYGELNGQRGLVPSNFLEGPGPAAGGSDKEPGASQAGSQDWASSTQGPPVPQGWPCIPGPGSFPRMELGGPQGTGKKVWGFLSKGKQLLRKLGSGKKE